MIQRILGVCLLFSLALAFALTAPAQGQGVQTNIVHPLFLFERSEALKLARQADCAMVATRVPTTNVTEERFPLEFQAVLPDACRTVYDIGFDGKIYTALKAKRQSVAPVTLEDYKSLILEKIGLEAVRSNEGQASDVYAYAIDRRAVVTKTFGRYSFTTGTDDYDKTRSEIWANSVCPKPGKGEICGLVKATGPQRFRRALERLIYALEFDRRQPKNTIRPTLDPIQIHGFYVEDLSDPKYNDSIGIKDTRKECPKKTQTQDSIYRIAFNCYVLDSKDKTKEAYPDYRVLLVYEPGSTLTRGGSNNDVVAMKPPVDRDEAPEEQFLVQFQEWADATTTVRLQKDQTKFPSLFQLRIADEPTEFVKTASSDPAKIAITVNQETKREEFAIDAAIGYRLSNTVDAKKEICEKTPWLLCNAQWSVSPFVAWQRTQSDERGADTDPERTRDVVFGGVQLGFEKIAAVPDNERFADFRRPPDWRSSLAIEYITDGDFEADVQRYSFLTSPPWPDFLPTYGYRGRLRLSELGLSENQIRARAMKDRGSITRCSSRFVCSVWFEWDGNIAIDHIDVDTAPFNLSTEEDPDDRLDLIDGTRFGFDLSATIGARSPLAFTSDTPWIEFKTEFQKRETFRSDGRQVELLKSSLALTDTHDGSFSVGIGYERGEDLRLGNELEQWTIELGLKH